MGVGNGHGDGSLSGNGPTAVFEGFGELTGVASGDDAGEADTFSNAAAEIGESLQFLVVKGVFGVEVGDGLEEFGFEFGAGGGVGEEVEGHVGEGPGGGFGSCGENGLCLFAKSHGLFLRVWKAGFEDRVEDGGVLGRFHLAFDLANDACYDHSKILRAVVSRWESKRCKGGWSVRGAGWREEKTYGLKLEKFCQGWVHGNVPAVRQATEHRMHPLELQRNVSECGDGSKCFMKSFLKARRFQMVVAESEAVLGDNISRECRVCETHVHRLPSFLVSLESITQELDLFLDERRIGHDGSAREPGGWEGEDMSVIGNGAEETTKSSHGIQRGPSNAMQRRFCCREHGTVVAESARHPFVFVLLGTFRVQGVIPFGIVDVDFIRRDANNGS